MTIKPTIANALNILSAHHANALAEERSADKKSNLLNRAVWHERARALTGAIDLLIDSYGPEPVTNTDPRLFTAALGLLSALINGAVKDTNLARQMGWEWDALLWTEQGKALTAARTAILEAVTPEEEDDGQPDDYTEITSQMESIGWGEP